MVKYTIGSEVTIVKEGKYYGATGTVTDHQGYNSAFPIDTTVWKYAVRLETGETKWFPESDLRH